MITIGFQLHETLIGQRFFQAQLPQLIKAIEANTAELKRANDLKEAELKHKGVPCHEEPTQAD